MSLPKSTALSLSCYATKSSSKSSFSAFSARAAHVSGLVAILASQNKLSLMGVRQGESRGGRRGEGKERAVKTHTTLCQSPWREQQHYCFYPVTLLLTPNPTVTFTGMAWTETHTHTSNHLRAKIHLNMSFNKGFSLKISFCWVHSLNSIQSCLYWCVWELFGKLLHYNSCQSKVDSFIDFQTVSISSLN